MRWLHEGIDRLYIGLMHRLVPPVFRDGTVSAPFQDQLAAVDLRMPALGAERQRCAVPARTMVGEVQAGFRWRPAPSPASPVLIYHHGLGEIPSDHTFRWIFRRRMPVDVHLVAIQAPFHRSYVDCCRGLASLSHFLAMCAVSVALIEAVRLACVARGAPDAIVTGISLGGFVALLHHLSYGTASRYAPLLAGPDLAHALLSTPCRGFLAQAAAAEPREMALRLDLRDAFRRSDARNVLPLLARHDRWMPYAHHLEAYAAKGVPVAAIDRGHMTGSWAFAALRAHLLSVLDTPPGGEAQGQPRPAPGRRV
jgi:hypothetical protein